jgi:hypothetical protein
VRFGFDAIGNFLSNAVLVTEKSSAWAESQIDTPQENDV